jgi:PAT family beta-lactamase induction signal transducer AmpG
MTATADTAPKQSRFMRSMRALRDRRMAAMLILSFASGLPYGAVLGTLNAWLTKVGVTVSDIGVLSLLGIGYAFKYLWAPAFQTPAIVPGLTRLGARRSWLVVLQLSMSLLIGVLAYVALRAVAEPPLNIGLVALIALIVALMSATHDIILDAWRIEVARSDEDKDMMSALYQFGYKSAGFITGFFALLMAARIGWPMVYLMIAAFLLISISGSLIAPEPESSHEKNRERLSYLPAVGAPVARTVMLVWAAAIAVALYKIGNFAVGTLVFRTAPKPAIFIAEQGPAIVALTVLLPTLIAAWMLIAKKAAASPLAAPPSDLGARTVQSLFHGIFDPLMDLLDRMRWGAVLVLLLALTYRFTDAVWGTFAYPFYLGTEHGALGHTLDDVGIASKFFGVLATIFGSFLGAVMIASLGRMPVFLLGAIVAAVTNLLYADLAAGAAWLDGLLSMTRLDVPLVAFAEWAAKISPEVTAVDQGQRMARLMVTIFIENIAGGFALVAMTAYLTSVVNPRFAAVQYALLASLTMLIGTLGRTALGDLIEMHGYYWVFVVTFWLGGVAVVLSALEWWRQSRLSKAVAA